MADGVQWIKMKVGMFDGESFKRIKKAKIGGVEFRDKLTAVWFELMDFAAKCNHDGALINSHEIPYKSLGDIATMIDRDESEVDLCMRFFVQEGMIEIIDDIYMLSAWQVYQNADALAKIRENNRNRVAAFRQRKRMEATELPALPEPEEKIEEPEPPKEKPVKERILEDFAGDDKELATALKEFEQMRTKMKSPLTERAKKMLITELKNLANNSKDWIAILNQSVFYNWKGVFALKDKGGQVSQEKQETKRPKYTKY